MDDTHGTKYVHLWYIIYHLYDVKVMISQFKIRVKHIEHWIVMIIIFILVLLHLGLNGFIKIHDSLMKIGVHSLYSDNVWMSFLVTILLDLVIKLWEFTSA